MLTFINTHLVMSVIFFPVSCSGIWEQFIQLGSRAAQIESNKNSNFFIFPIQNQTRFELSKEMYNPITTVWSLSQINSKIMDLLVPFLFSDFSSGITGDYWAESNYMCSLFSTFLCWNLKHSHTLRQNNGNDFRANYFTFLLQE